MPVFLDNFVLLDVCIPSLIQALMRVFTSGSPGAAKPFLGAKINVGKNVGKKKRVVVGGYLLAMLV